MGDNEVAIKRDHGDSGDENTKRGNWSGRFDFILSSVGYAVGLGNVWRFPYLAYRNGGGAFLIPYAIMLLIAGLPVFYFEMCLGQFANLGAISVWNLSPMFKGIGWSMVIISFIVGIYYNLIIGWAFYYLFASFTTKLPWDSCLNWYNDVRCRQKNSNVSGQTNIPGNNRTNKFPLDCTKNLTVNCTNYQSPAEQYWERIVLGMVDPSTGRQRFLSDGIGLPQWHVSLSLLLAWIIVFFCLIKGVKSSGKVVYFTATFPYIVLIALFINGIQLEGASAGIIFYVTPIWTKLLEPKVWGDAAVQIFYSLGISFGALLSMASYNKFKNNCYRDALIVAVLNCSTSIFAGFVIFSVIGYMSVKTGTPVATVAQSGPGLAFIAYPEGLATMPAAPVWSCLFFVMLITLGLDSQFGMLEAVISGVCDEYPVLAKTFTRKALFTGGLCMVLYLLGLPMVCKGGIYLFTLVDWYSASFSLMFVSLTEILAVMYVYGVRDFLKDIKMMLGFIPGPYWVGCWMVVSPMAIVFIFIFSCIRYTPVYYGSYYFPSTYEMLGWFMVVAGMLPIPVVIIIHLLKNNLDLRRAASPTASWGPCVEKYWADDPRYKQKLEMNQMSNGKPADGDGGYQPYPQTPYAFNPDQAYVNESYTKSNYDLTRM